MIFGPNMFLLHSGTVITDLHEVKRAMFSFDNLYAKSISKRSETSRRANHHRHAYRDPYRVEMFLLVVRSK
jgi:hypothetical protein